MENKTFEFKTLVAGDMIDYIKKNAPDKLTWFYTEAYEITKDGKELYNHLKAKKAFCGEFFPDLLPVKKTRVKATKELEDLFNNDTDFKKQVEELRKAKAEKANKQ